MKNTKNIISFKDLFCQSWEIYYKKIDKLIYLIIASFAIELIYLISEQVENFLLSLFLFILYLLFSILIFLFYILIINQLIESKKLKPKNFYKIVKNRYFQLLIVSILYLIIVIGGLLFLIIPGVIFFIWFYWANYNTILSSKKISILESFKKSQELVNKRWWQVFFKILLIHISIWGISIAVSLTLYYCLNIIFFMINFNILSNFNLFDPISSLMMSILAPVIIIMDMLLLKNLKKTK